MSDKTPAARPAAPRVLIIGGGFAGATAARTLERRLPAADIRLLSAENHLTYNPLLPELPERLGRFTERKMALRGGVEVRRRTRSRALAADGAIRAAPGAAGGGQHRPTGRAFGPGRCGGASTYSTSPRWHARCGSTWSGTGACSFHRTSPICAFAAPARTPTRGLEPGSAPRPRWRRLSGGARSPAASPGRARRAHWQRGPPPPCALPMR